MTKTATLTAGFVGCDTSWSFEILGLWVEADRLVNPGSTCLTIDWELGMRRSSKAGVGYSGASHILECSKFMRHTHSALGG